MKNLIMPVGVLIVFALAVVIFAGAQFATRDVVQAFTKVSEEECVFKSWSKSGTGFLDPGNRPQMVLDCKGETKITEDGEVIFAYLKNPVETFPCTLWASGSVTCKVPNNAPKNTEQK